MTPVCRSENPTLKANALCQRHMHRYDLAL
ncbi:MAG: hypothetical protein RLZ68_453, partial [Pseudomonadota bacterium]